MFKVKEGNEMTFLIKGNQWTIERLKEDCDGAHGTTDETEKKIRIYGKPNVPSYQQYGNWEFHIARTVRHELIHAFLHECGLGSNFEHPDFGHDETYVDWFANIYPEYKKVCQQLGV